MPTPKSASVLGIAIFALLMASPSQAQSAPKPAPYSLPWQLRPTTAATVLRSDTVVAGRETPDGQRGTTVATMFLASWKVSKGFAPMLRFGYVNDSLAGGQALLNPVVGGTWVFELAPGVRLAPFLGLTAPIGWGGGNTPKPQDAAALRAGIVARSSMDNAMFAVNDFTVFPGVGLSVQRGAFTAQLEATVLQLTRVRGEQAQADASRTNFTTGLHLGFFPVDVLSLGADLRYQRWLSTPASVTSPELRDNFTLAIGPRLYFKLGDVAFRPGISLGTGLDAPMSSNHYRLAQFDLPFVF